MIHILKHVRSNLVAYIALFVALGGTSYAAVSLPAGSVGTRQLKNGAVTGSKLKNGTVTPAKLTAAAAGAASVRAWAVLRWAGVWQVAASSGKVNVISTSYGELVTWKHTSIAPNCIASVTPTENVATTQAAPPPSPGYVTTQFSPGAKESVLQITAVGQNGTNQQQSVNVFVLCPTRAGKKAHN